MNTYVYKEILDKSISGDKIFGGEINWIDGLYTDHLAVPHTGVGGTGSIDGSAFTIGLTEKIAYAAASVVGAGSLFVWSSDYSHYAATIQSSATQYGTLHLNSASALNVFLTANLSSKSYHLPKLVIGSAAEVSSSYKFEVPNASWMGYIYGLYADYGTGFIGDLHFENHLSTWASIKTYTQLVDYLAPCLAGGVGPLLVSSLQKLVDDISVWQMEQIDNIEDAISTSNWYTVSELNQLVSIGSNVVFGDIGGTDITATGSIDGNTVTGDKLIIDGEGMIFKSAMHEEIRGLHLDWYYPLGSNSEIRIVVEEGTCLNGGSSERITLVSNMVKLINATWVAGSGNGGMPNSLSVQPSTSYWVFVIWNGSVADVGFDTAANAANLLSDSGYTHYRLLGKVHTDGSSKINMFEDVVMYYWGYRSTRSGFKLGVSISFVSSPFEVYAGAERLGRTIECWIQEGSADSNGTKLEYNFFTDARPVSLEINAVSATPCNFLNGAATPYLQPGEIRLQYYDIFECFCFDGTKIHNDGFGTSGLKGIQKLVAFTLHIDKDT